MRDPTCRRGESLASAQRGWRRQFSAAITGLAALLPCTGGCEALWFGYAQMVVRMKIKLAWLAILAPIAVLGSCAPKKAIVVEPPTGAPKDSAAAVAQTGPTEPALPGMPNDGIRLPDMLTMPSDNEFRSGTTPAPQGLEANAVIARPPTDPPSRPKPPKPDVPPSE